MRSLHLVFESHDGRALVPIPKRSTSPRGDIATLVVDSLKALDLERPIREADMKQTCRIVREVPTGDIAASAILGRELRCSYSSPSDRKPRRD